MRAALLIAPLLILAANLLSAGQTSADADAEYTRVINGRADKIVVELGIEDADEASAVRDLIAGWYRSLSTLHDARDAEEKTEHESAAEQLALHRRFVAQLETRLTPEQVDGVKNGLTYGVAPNTFRVYLDLLPDLTSEQKREILAHLLEAREYAMDAGSSEEKHAWFRKYKGRINNYLSEQGYDLKSAEARRDSR